MREFEVSITANRSRYIEGFKFSIEPQTPVKKTIPGSTAIHEAMHAVAALENGTSVDSVTIVPGDGYLGLTKLGKADAVAAMAPHSMGKAGTGHDVFIAGIIGNAGAAESVARGIINSNMDKVEAVASVLEEKRTIGSGEIHSAIDEIKNPKPISVTLFIESPTGEQRKERVEVRDNIVMVPGVWVNVSEKQAKKI